MDVKATIDHRLVAVELTDMTTQEWYAMRSALLEIGYGIRFRDWEAAVGSTPRSQYRRDFDRRWRREGVSDVPTALVLSVPEAVRLATALRVVPSHIADWELPIRAGWGIDAQTMNRIERLITSALSAEPGR